MRYSSAIMEGELCFVMSAFTSLAEKKDDNVHTDAHIPYVFMLVSGASMFLTAFMPHTNLNHCLYVFFLS